MSQIKDETVELADGASKWITKNRLDDAGSGLLDSLCLDNFKRKRLLAKDVIYHESDHIDMVYVIRSGLVKQLSYLPNGRARIVRLHSHDHWLGLEGLMGQFYEHTAIAIDDVELYCIPLSYLRRVEQSHPHYHGEVMRHWHTYLTQADMWIANFSTGGIKARVARLVEFLARLEYGNADAGVELLTVHEMAEILGVTPESVSRTLAQFKRNQILYKQNNGSKEMYQIDTERLHFEARQ